MAFREALGAASGGGLDIFAELADEFDGDDPGGDGDDGVSHDHHEGGDHLADDGVGGDIAVAHGGDGDDGPVDGLGDTGELVRGSVGVVVKCVWAFYEIHDRAHDDGEREDAEEEHRDFSAAGTEGVEDDMSFPEVASHFENAEHAQHAEDTDDEEVF